MKRLLLASTIVALTLVSASRATSQTVQFPATHAGRAVQGWLRAVNSDDSALMKTFGRDSMAPVGTDSVTMARRAGSLAKFHATFGQAIPESIESSSDTSFSMFMRSAKDGSSTLFLFYTERAAPYRLAVVLHVGEPF
jgi:hypothetical protein